LGSVVLVFAGCPTSDDINLGEDTGLGQWDIVLDLGEPSDDGPPPPPDIPKPPDDGPPPACTSSDECEGVIEGLELCEVAVCDLDTNVCIAGLAADGATCDDNNPCTITLCSAGICEVTDIEECDDGNPCTTDKCIDSANGCQNIPNLDPCDDGNSCTIGDICGGGVCLPGNTNTCSCTGQPDGELCDDGNASTLGDFCFQDGCGGFEFSVFNPAGNSLSAGFVRMQAGMGTIMAVGTDLRGGQKWTWAVSIVDGQAVYHQQSARTDTEYLAVGDGLAAGTNGRVSRWLSGQSWEKEGTFQTAVNNAPSSTTFGDISAVWSDGSVALLFGRNAANSTMKITRCDGIEASPTCKSVGLANATGYHPRMATSRPESSSLTGPLVAVNSLASAPRSLIIKHPGANSNTMNIIADIASASGMEWRDLAIAPDDKIWGVGSLGLTVRGSGTAFASLPALPNKDLDAAVMAGDHILIFGQSESGGDSNQMLWIHKRGDNDYEPSAYHAVEIPVDSIRIVDAVVDSTAITVITKPTGSSNTSGAWIGTRTITP